MLGPLARIISAFKLQDHRACGEDRIRLAGVVMTNAETDKLYLNLIASQTRKRLKGFGHGVKRVEATGRKQSVIVHTATGQHLEELTSLFSDVANSTRRTTLGTPIENLRNLGPTSAAWLREVNVHDEADLKRVGPALAYRLVQRMRPDVSLNLLWAMAAALSDRDWRELSTNEKQQLRREIQEP